MKGSPVKYTRTVAKWVSRVCLSALLVLILGAVTVLIVIPRATHGVALTVISGSMTPTIPVGSVVIDRPVDPGTLKVGDIATYQEKPGVATYITHRIVKIDTSTTPTSFTFKGDANRGPDIEPVPAGAIRGKVWFHVPYLGSIRDSLSAPFGRTALIALVALALAGYAGKQFYDVIRDRRRGKRAPEGGSLPEGFVALRMDFPLDAFGDVDPLFVAELLQAELADGEVERVGESSFRLGFAGPPERVAVIRDLLLPHGSEVPPEDDVVAAAVDGSAEPDWSEPGDPDRTEVAFTVDAGGLRGAADDGVTTGKAHAHA